MSERQRNILTAKGRLRCRFDMTVRWPEHAGRLINPLTVRGDRFGDTDPDKMLKMLLRYLIRDHKQWAFAQLHDNSIPMDDRNRVVIKYYRGKIVINRLHYYFPLLQDFILPEYLKQQI